MHAARVVVPFSSLVLLLALAGCSQAVGDPGAADAAAARARDVRDLVGSRYPADVYRPADYVLQGVDDAGGVLTLRGAATGRPADLFAQARAAMPMQGWAETRADDAGARRMLAFEKAGYRAQLSFEPRGRDATALALRFQRP